ncbi:DUF5008 domain-containing protein [Pedobacter frigoris]|uniref:DUF5008 domain-containing protein n=1 Tax=Pedobacter frigoris TaxID=2571272 RepID=UPI002931E682|nr:DUF5008 domain-containing protein [Pedobacter frigoris]
MKFKYTGLFIVIAGLLLSSCKDDKTVFENPYDGGKAPLGIITNAQQIPVPAAGYAGTEVTITATGLVQHKANLKFLFNGQEAEIVEVTETGIKVKVPIKASSGVTSFVVNGQLVFGPVFTVMGKVTIDPTYVAINGTNGAVNSAFILPDNNIILLGGFTNYNNHGAVRELRRIVRTFPNGTWDRSYLSGNASNGTLSSMATLNGWSYIAGGFSGYAQRGDISNITRISAAGVIDTVQATTYTLKTKNVPKFNGGVTGYIRSLYSFGGKLVATGDFTYYVKRRYDINSYKYQDSTAIDSSEVRQLVRFHESGELDSTWRYDLNAIGYKGKKGKSWAGGNGRLFSLMHADGKLLCYGQFNKFDDAAAGYIVRLNPDGTIDPTFTPGTGANDYIDHVSYSPELNKYIAVGRFRSFNGKESKNMVLLNYDGTVDQTFAPKVFIGGAPYFVKLLKDGLAVVGGDFKSYDGVVRNGFLILDKTGNLAEGYNTTGNVVGSQAKFNDIYETTSADGKRALLIMGQFNVFDNKPINNIIRVVLE